MSDAVAAPQQDVQTPSADAKVADKVNAFVASQRPNKKGTATTEGRVAKLREALGATELTVQDKVLREVARKDRANLDKAGRDALRDLGAVCGNTPATVASMVLAIRGKQL